MLGHTKQVIKKYLNLLKGNELATLPSNDIIDLGYRVILRRSPDPGGFKHFSERIGRGDLNNHDFLNVLVQSEEFVNRVQRQGLGPSIHYSRGLFVKSFPQAQRIVDLGGADQSAAEGAFVKLGYPYDFTQLTIVDLPHEERHALYAHGERLDKVASPRGPVEYVYQSMCDLSFCASNSVDLVYSGQTIEHVHEHEGDQVCAEVMRLLRPGGYFCLDTPNGRVTRLQQAEFVDPDHKIEYTHEQLSAKLLRAGFTITTACGLNYLGAGAKTAHFDAHEVARHPGLYADIRNCYLLGYVCQKPL